MRHRVLSTTLWITLSILFLAYVNSTHATSNQRGFVENPDAKNLALLVGVSHGLPGIDIDIKNMKNIGSHEAYNFTLTTLLDETGTADALLANLTNLSKQVTDDGTFFFYFTGHGYYDLISLEDRTVTIFEIRDAIKAARKKLGPLSRLVLVFDACHSGSLIDPVRIRMNSRQMADAVLSAFTERARNEKPYWEKLVIVASTEPDETCMAGYEGSDFTNAFVKGFGEAVQAKETIGKFIELTQEYTVDSHPTARLVPSTLTDELLIP